MERVLCRIVEAVAFVHERDIIHRDLKPENVVMDSAVKDARPFLIDFGISKDLSITASTSRAIAGSVAYLAPEMLLLNAAAGGNATVSTKVDMYALGVIFYQVSGNVLFTVVAMYVLCQFYSLRNLQMLFDGDYGLPTRLDTAQADMLRNLSTFGEDGFAILTTALLSIDPEKRPSARDVLERVTGIHRASSKAEDALHTTEIEKR